MNGLRAHLLGALVMVTVAIAHGTCWGQPSAMPPPEVAVMRERLRTIIGSSAPANGAVVVVAGGRVVLTETFGAVDESGHPV